MCDVGGFDDPCQVWAKTTPRARREYPCVQCDRPIVKGERYLRVGALYDGCWTTVIAHVACDEIARHIAFEVCEQEIYFLESDLALRENVREHMREAPEVLRMYRDHLRQRNQAERGAA